MKIRFPGFMRENPSLAMFALLAMATSGFGQTFFFSVFGAGIRDSFKLSNANYGSIYGAATLMSALLLLKAGELVDRWSLRKVTILAVGLLATGCLLIGLAPHWMLLLPGFLLARFGGQAMMSHIGITTAGRYFKRNRGRVMAMTAAGIPLAEASLPAAATGLLVVMGWRLPWLLAVVVLLAVALPLLLWLARSAPAPDTAGGPSQLGEDRDLTRADALRDPGFYLILPGAMAAPFVVTALLFHQASIAALKGWSMSDVGLAFTGFALGHFFSLFFAGPLVDRLGAQRALSLSMVPIVVGLLVLAFWSSSWTPYVYLFLTGICLGGVATAGGAIWPERYGVRFVGSIRSAAQAVMVLSTAVSPVLVGLLLDHHVTVSTVALLLAGYSALAGVLIALVPPVRLPGRQPVPDNR